MWSEGLTGGQKEVMEVVRSEIIAFGQKDFEAYQKCWAHEVYIRRTGWCTGGGVSDVVGWDLLKRLVIRLFDDFPDPEISNHELNLQNLVVRVSGDMAFVTFDRQASDWAMPDIDMSGCSREGRVLQRFDGEWRMVYMDYIHNTAVPSNSPVFKVDRKGTVGWMNESAELAAKHGNTLKMVAGRLVANNSRDTQAMRLAIQQASDCGDALKRGRACIPILLQSGPDDCPSVCWVTTERSGSAAVIISINNLGLAQEKLDAASVVFGLSRTQQRLAELIASGYDVVASSGLLGVTVNTAKTHLQRIFDKTGVRSQAALIRTLLSIERPD